MTPDASIIVTTYNRPDAIRALLESILNLEWPMDRLEVVVVDDGSSEPIEPLLKAYKSRLNLVVHRQENSGPAIGRNVAVGLAAGNYVAMLDDDCRPEPTWLRCLLEVLDKHPDAMAGGHTVNGLPENIYSTVSQMIVDRVYAAHNANPMRAGFFTSSNLAVRRELLLSLGGFDPAYRFAGGEDRGLCDHWRNAGRLMIFEPRARIHHFHELTFRRFVRQHFNYGRGAIYYHFTRRTKGRDEARTAREIVFNWNAWSAELAAQPPRHSRMAMVALLFCWQFANALGYFWEMITRSFPFATTRSRSKRGSTPQNAS